VRSRQERLGSKGMSWYHPETTLLEFHRAQASRFQRDYESQQHLNQGLQSNLRECTQSKKGIEEALRSEVDPSLECLRPMPDLKRRPPSYNMIWMKPAELNHNNSLT
jgi:hypothetical protein